MPNKDTSFPWVSLIETGVITGVAAAFLYIAGWSYAYHYFQCFHLGLIGLGIENEYFLLYDFWVWRANLHWMLPCLLAAISLCLLFQRFWQQRPDMRSQLRAVAQIGVPTSLLLLFLALYQLGAWTGQADFAREQREDFPSYPRAQIFMEKQDERAKDLAKGCYRLLLRGNEQLYLFRADGVTDRIPTEIVSNSEVAAVRLLPSYQTPNDCR